MSRAFMGPSKAALKHQRNPLDTPLTRGYGLLVISLQEGTCLNFQGFFGLCDCEITVGVNRS
jgi:hypothetical protein